MAYPRFSYSGRPPPNTFDVLNLNRFGGIAVVKIYDESITDEIVDVAKMISQVQKDDVTVITPTETLEVRYEKVSETQTITRNQKQTSPERE